MKIKALHTRVFKEGDNLIEFITSRVNKISEDTILVVTSKVVALAERRTVTIDHSIPLDTFREKIIRAESQFAIRTKYTWLTIKDGMVMASAGIDESNADGKIVLLPVDSFKSALKIRQTLMKKYKLKNLGVLITDSRLLPLRAGVVGVALGYAGFRGVRDYRGTKDIFGRIMKVSRTDVADSLATAAVLLMGEGNECRPLAIIEDAPVVFTLRTNRKELLVDLKEDIYQPLFEVIKKIKII